jgi:hypothetical protein
MTHNKPLEPLKPARGNFNKIARYQSALLVQASYFRSGRGFERLKRSVSGSRGKNAPAIKRKLDNSLPDSVWGWMTKKSQR